MKTNAFDAPTIEQRREFWLRHRATRRFAGRLLKGAVTVELPPPLRFPDHPLVIVRKKDNRTVVLETRKKEIGDRTILMEITLE